MDADWCYTLFANVTDCEIKIKYGFENYTLKPKSVVRVYWQKYDMKDTLLPSFCLQGVELDRDISHQHLYNNKGITIFENHRSSYSQPEKHFSFRTMEFLTTALRFMADQADQAAPEFNYEHRTTFVNNTDNEIQIEYDGIVYTLKPMSGDNIQWSAYDRRETLLPRLALKGDVASRYKLIPVQILYESLVVIISKGADNKFSIQTLSNKDLRKAVSSMQELLLRMMEHLKKVRIWHNQCKHLVHKYRVGVDRVLKELNNLILEVGRYDVGRQYSKPFIEFICPQLLSSMLEAEALLLFCGDNHFKKAAFELSSPTPSRSMTYSRFALVLRTLDWTLDFIQFFLEGQLIIQVGDESSISAVDWRWCERRCRTIYCPGYSIMIERGLIMEDIDFEADADGQGSNRENKHFDEADGHRELQDRYALQKSLKGSSASAFAAQGQDKFEAVWMKRLLGPASHTLGPSSISDCFLLDGLLDFKIEEHLGGGSFKQVFRCTWLEEMVAIAKVKDISEKQLREVIHNEVALLATVQHPNVVQLMGYAYRKFAKHFEGHMVTELMEEDLEDLINHQLRSPDGSETTKDGPPFALPVAIDIALQIVEAMIHVHKCGVLHRDLKPKNCLVSPKYQKVSLPGFSDVPMYYTAKLIDFGISKMRSTQDSYFHTPRQGTPSYMAPELNIGRADQEQYTWSADVWSFGMICYKLFTGKDPFAIAKGRLNYISDSIKRGDRPVFPPEFRADLKELIGKCWDKSPSARPDFQDIRRELWRIKLFAWSQACGLSVHNTDVVLSGPQRSLIAALAKLWVVKYIFSNMGSIEQTKVPKQV